MSKFNEAIKQMKAEGFQMHEITRYDLRKGQRYISVENDQVVKSFVYNGSNAPAKHVRIIAVQMTTFCRLG